MRWLLLAAICYTAFTPNHSQADQNTKINQQIHSLQYTADENNNPELCAAVASAASQSLQLYIQNKLKIIAASKKTTKPLYFLLSNDEHPNLVNKFAEDYLSGQTLTVNMLSKYWPLFEKLKLAPPVDKEIEISPKANNIELFLGDPLNAGKQAVIATELKETGENGSVDYSEIKIYPKNAKNIIIWQVIPNLSEGYVLNSQNVSYQAELIFLLNSSDYPLSLSISGSNRAHFI